MVHWLVCAFVVRMRQRKSVLINRWPVFSVQSQSLADSEFVCFVGGGGVQGVNPHPEKHNLLYVPLEILVQNPFEKQLDPRREAIGPEDPIASRVRSVKYDGDFKKKRKKSGSADVSTNLSPISISDFSAKLYIVVEIPFPEKRFD